MKKYLLAFALILPFMASAMKIATDEIDEFTGKRTVITSWESLSKNEIHIRFRLQNGFTILDLKFMSRESIVIPKDSPLLFKAINDSIGTFTSINLYSGGIGEGAVGLNGSGVWGISAKYEGDIAWFNTNVTKLIRIYTTDVYYDRKVSESDGKKLCKLYSLFSKTVNGKPGDLVLNTYTIKFVKRGVDARNWDLVKEETYPEMTKEEIQAIVEEWKAQSTENKLYDCQVRKEK